MTNNMWLAVVKATNHPSTRPLRQEVKRELKTESETETAVGALVELKAVYGYEGLYKLKKQD